MAVLRLVGIALILRLAWAIYSPALPTSDFGCYDHLAWSMVEGRGYQDPPYFAAPTAFWPPGYPFFLAAVYKVVGHSYRIAYILNAILSALTCYLVLLLGKHLTSEKAAWYGAYALALFPDHIALSGLLASENLFIPLLLGAVLLTWSWPLQRGVFQALTAGVLFGLASLTRLVGLFLFIPALWPWRKVFPGGLAREGMQGATLIILGWLIALCPWVLRNSLVFGEFPVLSTQSWQNLYEGVRENGSWWGVSLQGHPLASLDNEAEREHAARRLWFDSLRRNPRRIIHLFWPKVRMLLKIDTGYLSHYIFARPSRLVPWVGGQEAVLYLLTSGCYALWLILISTGFLLCRSRNDPERALVLVSLFAIVMCGLSIANCRHRVPLEVLWAPYVGLGLTRIASWNPMARRKSI